MSTETRICTRMGFARGFEIPDDLRTDIPRMDLRGKGRSFRNRLWRLCHTMSTKGPMAVFDLATGRIIGGNIGSLAKSWIRWGWGTPDAYPSGCILTSVPKPHRCLRYPGTCGWAFNRCGYTDCTGYLWNRICFREGERDDHAPGRTPPSPTTRKAHDPESP